MYRHDCLEIFPCSGDVHIWVSFFWVSPPVVPPGNTVAPYTVTTSLEQNPDQSQRMLGIFVYVDFHLLIGWSTADALTFCESRCLFYSGCRSLALPEGTQIYTWHVLPTSRLSGSTGQHVVEPPAGPRAARCAAYSSALCAPVSRHSVDAHFRGVGPYPPCSVPGQGQQLRMKGCLEIDMKWALSGKPPALSEHDLHQPGRQDAGRNRRSGGWGWRWSSCYTTPRNRGRQLKMSRRRGVGTWNHQILDKKTKRLAAIFFGVCWAPLIRSVCSAVEMQVSLIIHYKINK